MKKSVNPYVYDIETYPNFFSIVIGSTDTRKCWSYEISERKDQRESIFKLLSHLMINKIPMVGFNNIGFDYPVLHFLMKNKSATYQELYKKAMSIIQSYGGDDKFAHMVKKSEWMIPQIDLFKIHHFDNKAKATSLKMIEFNMRSDDIQDLPYDPSKPLTFPQMDDVLKYNKHDMYQTYLFYKETEEAIEFRQSLGKKYKMDFINHNDTKIGKDYFVKQLEKETPECCYKIVGSGANRSRKINQTKRPKIDLGEVILPYISFNRPEFKAIHEWFSKKVIRETKGVMTDLLEHELGEVAKYAEMVTKRKKLKDEPTEEEIKQLKHNNSMCWVEEKILKSGKSSWYVCWNVATSLNVVVNGLRYDYGVGGLHGSVESTIIKSDDEWVILDFDYASMYPNIAIANKLHPEHLGETFCSIYEDVYNQRKSFAKGTPENAVMKLALNGTYGASNDKFSPFYDPKFTMAITINGQLTLSALADRLLNVPDLKVLQLNTDGLTVYCKRSDEASVDKIVSDWDSVCGLTMEKAVYSMMAIRDVNNYIAVYDESGKVKRNGAYQYEGLGWHQNQSALVIPMAAEYEILGKGTVEDFILSHKDKFDFMLRTKVPRSSRLVLRMTDDDGYIIEDKPLQNICRYYISKNGGKLIKIMPPLPDKVDEREIGIDKSWNVKICNRIKDYDGDIDFDYYIQEAKKLVEPLTHT